MWLLLLLSLSEVSAQGSDEASGEPAEHGPEGSLNENPAGNAPGQAAATSPGTRNFLVVLNDEMHTTEGLSVGFSLGNGEQTVQVNLQDDGRSPDAEAGDGRFVAAVTAPGGEPALAVLSLSDGRVLWEDPGFAVPANLEQPSLLVDVGTDGVVNGRLVVDEFLPPLVPPMDQDRPHSQSGFINLLVSLGPPILVGLGSGCGLAFLLPMIRRRESEGGGLAPRPEVPWPPGLSGPKVGHPVCWQLPDEGARTSLLAGLARHHSVAGPVLLASVPGSRPGLAALLGGLPPVLVPARDGASAVGLAAAAEELGEGLVLVAGPRALEPPMAGEQAEAPVD